MEVLVTFAHLHVLLFFVLLVCLAEVFEKSSLTRFCASLRSFALLLSGSTTITWWLVSRRKCLHRIGDFFVSMNFSEQVFVTKAIVSDLRHLPSHEILHVHLTVIVHWVIDAVLQAFQIRFDWRLLLLGALNLLIKIKYWMKERISAYDELDLIESLSELSNALRIWWMNRCGFGFEVWVHLKFTILLII